MTCIMNMEKERGGRESRTETRGEGRKNEVVCTQLSSNTSSSPSTCVPVALVSISLSLCRHERRRRATTCSERVKYNRVDDVPLRAPALHVDRQEDAKNEVGERKKKQSQLNVCVCSSWFVYVDRGELSLRAREDDDSFVLSSSKKTTATDPQVHSGRRTFSSLLLPSTRQPALRPACAYYI